jgi:mono/diheme cytochrome c family protein
MSLVPGPNAQFEMVEAFHESKSGAGVQPGVSLDEGPCRFMGRKGVQCGRSNLPMNRGLMERARPRAQHFSHARSHLTLRAPSSRPLPLRPRTGALRVGGFGSWSRCAVERSWRLATYSIAQVLLLALFPSLTTTIFAQQKDAEQHGGALSVSFTNQIAPILARKCLTCHGPEKSKGGFRLDTFELLLKPGESKTSSLVSGNPQQSELFRRITIKDEDDRMPQKADPLPDAEIVLIERWIKEGARFDGADSKAPLVSLVPRTPHPDPPANYARPVPVMALAFGLDGRELAIGGYHEITIWNPGDGKLLRRITNVAQRTQSLAYSSAGVLAAAGGSPGQSGEVTLFDPGNGTLIKVLGTTTDMMLDVKFSPDGTRLAVCGADNAIHVYDIATGKEQLRIEQHADWVMAVDFSRDGTQLASASRDKTARLFDSKTGELESTFVGHTAAVFDVVFNDDGKTVCSVGRDKKIHIWEIKDAKAKAEIGIQSCCRRRSHFHLFGG